MSDTTATMLQDKLNSIERNAYDGIDFSQEVTAAYVLADELGERIDQLSAENAKLRELSKDLFSALFNEASRQHVTTIGEMQGFLNRMAELNILHEASKLGIEADE